jgi:uncharacterized membrane protein
MSEIGVYPFRSQRRTQESSSDDRMPTVAEKNISAMLKLEKEALEARSAAERVADAVTTLAVKPWFIAVHALAYAVWILANTTGPWRFDPRPFNLLNSIISIEAIFLMLLVLASQQRMLRMSDRRAHLNLQVDLLSEQEMTVMLRMLERLFEHFHLDPAAAAPQSAELAKTTDLEALVDNLDRRMMERK